MCSVPSYQWVPLFNNNITVEPRFNKVAGDRPNLFDKWRVCYIENLNIKKSEGKRPKCLLYRGHISWLICNTGDFCGNTVVPMPMTYNKPLTERLLSLYHKD